MKNPEKPPQKCTLRRVPLNSGGYDTNGHYYGVGKPLFWAYDEHLKLDEWLRANDRSAAKAHLKSRFPTIKFFN